MFELVPFFLYVLQNRKIHFSFHIRTFYQIDSRIDLPHKRSNKVQSRTHKIYNKNITTPLTLPQK